MREGKDLGGKEEKRGPWNLCVMRVNVGTVWRREGIIEGVGEQLWI